MPPQVSGSIEPALLQGIFQASNDIECHSLITMAFSSLELLYQSPLKLLYILEIMVGEGRGGMIVSKLNLVVRFWPHSYSLPPTIFDTNTPKRHMLHPMGCV